MLAKVLAPCTPLLPILWSNTEQFPWKPITLAVKRYRKSVKQILLIIKTMTRGLSHQTHSILYIMFHKYVRCCTVGCCDTVNILNLNNFNLNSSKRARCLSEEYSYKEPMGTRASSSNGREETR